MRAIISSLICATFSSAVAAAEPGQGAVAEMLRNEIAKRFPHAQIVFAEDIHWTTQEPHGALSGLVVGEENARGQVQFTIQATTDEGTTSRGYGWVTFEARVPARIAVRRVMPGEAIRPDQFTTQEVNISSGMVREYRGILFPQETSLSQLQARQTIVEGQPLLSTAVERIPDVRQGDEVRVQLVSSGLTLSTAATATEPGYLNGRVRVLTDKTKRELSGTLVAAGVVEVRL